MKAINTKVITAVIFMLSYILIPGFSNAQYILAGQTEGENIYYFDIEDSYIFAITNDADYKVFDIDGNNDDLEFYVQDITNSKNVVSISLAIPLNNTKIVTLEDEENWIKKFEYGDSISNDMHWWNDGDGTLYVTDQTYSWGEFVDTGYLAFKVNDVHPMIGWFKLRVSYAFIEFFEYAFYSDTFVGYNVKSGNGKDIKIQNPVNNELFINVSVSLSTSNWEYQVYNLSGEFLKQGNLYSGKNYIFMNDISPGIFLLSILDENKNSSSYKLLKL